MEIVREKEKYFRQGDWGIKYLFRGPRIDWGIVSLLPGKKMGTHYHREVEETFYILEGSGILTVDGEDFPVESGMAIQLKPGEKHDLRSGEGISLKGLFIKVPYLPDDKVDG